MAVSYGVRNRIGNAWKAVYSGVATGVGAGVGLFTAGTDWRLSILGGVAAALGIGGGTFAIPNATRQPKDVTFSPGPGPLVETNITAQVPELVPARKRPRR